MTLQAFLKQQTSKRKLRLFAVACCDQIRNLITNSQSINALRVAEQFADDLATKEELKSTYNLMRSIARIGTSADVAVLFTTRITVSAANVASFAANAAVDFAIDDETYDETEGEAYEIALNAAYAAIEEKQMKIAQDIFYQANKLIVPKNELITSIAKHIYWNKEWKEMTILADALEDTKASDKIINHLRSKEPHYRGCWVLDLILNKK